MLVKKLTYFIKLFKFFSIYEKHNKKITAINKYKNKRVIGKILEYVKDYHFL